MFLFTLNGGKCYGFNEEGGGARDYVVPCKSIGLYILMKKRERAREHRIASKQTAKDMLDTHCHP